MVFVLYLNNFNVHEIKITLDLKLIELNNISV
jgi:hypothetical protein